MPIPATDPRLAISAHGDGSTMKPISLFQCQGKKTATRSFGLPFDLEVPPGFGPGNEGFADLCLTTWLWHRA